MQNTDKWGAEEKDVWLGYKLNERVDASSIDMTKIYFLVLIILTGSIPQSKHLQTYGHAKSIPKGAKPTKREVPENIQYKDINILFVF